MTPIILLIALLVVQCCLSPKKGLRYRNIDAVVASLAILGIDLLADLLLGIFSPTLQSAEEIFYFLIMIQAITLIVLKLHTKKRDSLIKYGIPSHYTTGWRRNLIETFYDFNSASPVVYTKSATSYLGMTAWICATVLASFFIYQTNTYSTAGNTLLLPYSMGGLLSFLMEFAIFCMGESLWKKLLTSYRRRKSCRNRREYANARYASEEDYSYIFMKNLAYELTHISRATMFRWKKDVFETFANYYDFQSHIREKVEMKEYNPELEEFIKQNNLEVNPWYVAVYNLIDRNQNVLLKTPSYVDFEPYLAAMVKMKVAKTQKIVLIVSNEEKKRTTQEKLIRSFNEYFGFDNIPLFSTIDEYYHAEQDRLRAEQKIQSDRDSLGHFMRVAELNGQSVSYEESAPEKAPDVVILAPEDVCDLRYTGCVRSIIEHLGLIVYYDFSDSVQEEALFAKIIHSVMDYRDKVSTLYLSDGFFDLEQVVDNFFSQRNIYEIRVPRQPSQKSYITGWKAENISEMQSRTDPDPARNIGNHIPILFDATNHTENDLMIVEDEFDTYAENRSRISKERIASRFDFHVGWTDVLGGNSVICAVSDTYNNAAHTYCAMNGIGSHCEYINIISRPYLLRNYLMYHLRFFSCQTDALSSYSPGIIKTPRAISYEAVIKAFLAGCTKEQLKKYILETHLPSGESPEFMLRQLVACACDEEWNPMITKSLDDRYFVDYNTYDKIIKESGLMEKIEFINQNNQVFIRNKRDYSYLIPHQKIVLNGTKYTVENIDGNRVELMDSNTREPMFVSRAIRTCEATVNSVEANDNIIQHNGNSSMMLRRLSCDVKLNVSGSIVYRDSYHPFCDNATYDYHQLLQPRITEYKNVNVFCIKLGSTLITPENRNELAHLTAVLLNEMLPTFFPRHSERIIIGCSGWEINSDIADGNVTTMHTAAQMNINDPDPAGDQEFCLYILEDSSIETGLVNVFWQDEEIRYMLRIMEDYLYYQAVIRKQEAKEILGEKNEILHTLRKVLLRVINETVEYYDSQGNLCNDYINKIRNSRNKFNALDINKKFNLTCDFCGKPVGSSTNQSAGYHFYSYSGSISCMTCYKTAVCSEKDPQEQVRRYEALINGWFGRKYKESVHNRFYNYLEDAERIAELTSTNPMEQPRYVVTDDCEAMVVAGLSYYNPENHREIRVANNGEDIAATAMDVCEDPEDWVRASYKVEAEDLPFIIIRDGLPQKEYLGVLCHEMTHQWQFSNLDINKMRNSILVSTVNEFGQTVTLPGLCSEGHAEWERIQYLKSIKAKGVRKMIAALKARQDEYGLGYLWMCNMMKVGHDDLRIHADRTFGFVMKRNWYQLTKNSMALMRLYFGSPFAEEPPQDEIPDDTQNTTDTPLDQTDTDEVPLDDTTVDDMDFSDITDLGDLPSDT